MLAMACNTTFSIQLLVCNKMNTFWMSKLSGLLICSSDGMLHSLLSFCDKTYFTETLRLCSLLEICVYESNHSPCKHYGEKIY